MRSMKKLNWVERMEKMRGIDRIEEGEIIVRI